MMIEAIDYMKNRKPTGVDDTEAEEIQVLVLSGDEILTIRKTDGTTVEADACDDRFMQFYDGRYTVSDIEKWMARKDAYDGFEYGR